MSADGLEQMSDESLAEQFRASGDAKYFEEIWRRHAQPVFCRCLRFLRNSHTAEDLTSDTFLRVLEGIRKYRPENFSAWVSTIARNVCVNYVRSAVARHECMAIEDLKGDHSDDKRGFNAEVEEVLNQLPERQRRTLKLFFIDGYSYKEIVKLTGYSIKEVKSYVQNGKRKFRLLWERIGKAAGRKT